MLTHIAFGLLLLAVLYLLREYYKLQKVAKMLLRQNTALQVDLFAAKGKLMRLELTRWQESE